MRDWEQDCDSSMKACLRKRSYDTEREARRVKKEMIAKHGDSARTLHVYLCEICKRFHLGH